MPSINAKNAALEVLETVRKGRKVKLGKILKNNGYAETTSTVPTQVTNTKSYKSVIEPVVRRMEKERDRIIQSLEVKDLTDEKYRDLVDSLDKLTKNIQLLNGGATERQGISISFDGAFNEPTP